MPQGECGCDEDEGLGFINVDAIAEGCQCNGGNTFDMAEMTCIADGDAEADENEDGEGAADDEAEENADENEADENEDADEIDGGDDGVDGDGNSIADDAAVDLVTAASCNLDGGKV